MEWVKLGDVCDNLDSLRKPLNNLERQSISKKKLYPYYGANNIIDYVDEFIFDEEILCVAEDGGNWGYNEICSYIVCEKCWVNNHAHVLTAKSNVNIRYISYYLNYCDLSKHITGTTRGKLNKSELNKIKIPKMPLEIQEKIVQVLDNAQSLIDKRKKQISLFDKLTESIFYEMFGDPVKNEKGWEVKEWSNIFNTITGKLNSNAMVENGKYPFFTCAKEVYRIDSYTYDCEALLLAGNNASADYDVKYYNGKFDAYQRTYILTLKNKYNYLYFKFILEKQLLLMKQISKGTNTRYLTLKILQSFKLPLPPLPLQNQFATKVEEIERQKKLLDDSLVLLEDNYKALMQRAFKGELFE